MDKRSIPPGLARALRWYKRALRAQFGKRLKQVALFGSRARGDAREHSDVDVLVLIDRATHDEVREAIGLAGDACVATEVWLSAKVYSSERMRYLLSIESPFARSAMADAISV